MNELKPFRNWVVTYPHDKIPLNPFTGRKADVTDPATWGDFGTADACVSINKHLLLGFVLTGTPYSCVDLDTHKTTDRAMIGYHKQLFETFHTYSELSPNGGVHLWCKGKLTVDGKRFPQQLVEVYCEKRYITITRQPLNGGVIEDRQQYLNDFVNWATQWQRSQITQPNSSPEVNTDAEICEMAANAFNGELFKELYMGNWKSRYDTQSEADQAICNIIAFYTDSKEQTCRIFHNSVMGQRKKAQRLDYLYDKGYGLITRAFDQKLPNVRFGDIENIIKNKVNEEALKAIAAPVPGFTPYTPTKVVTIDSIKKQGMLPDFVTEELELDYAEFPVGLTGDIAKFIYRNAYRPVKEIAVAAAVAFMAGMCGRFYNISNMGLNHYIAILAPTGTGKEGGWSGVERIVAMVKEKCDTIEKFIGPQAIASPQALMRHLSDWPCFVSRKAELGLWLNRLTSRRANDNVVGLRALLLDLYTRSGWRQIVREEIRADSRKDTPSVTAPSFSLYGDSTPEIFYASLDEEQLDQGLISRFLVIECGPDPLNMYNPNHDLAEPDPGMIDRIAGLAKYAMAGNAGKLNKSIDMTPEAVKYLDEFRKECDTKLLENPSSPEAKVYTRGCERLLRLAGLVAVGEHPDYPVVSLPIAMWAKKFILRSMMNVILKFERGEVGENNLYILQRNVMVKIIRHYWKEGYKETFLKNYNISKDMYDAKIITRNYLSSKTRGHSAFRKSRNMKMDFDNALIDLTKNGILVGPIEMGKVRESMRTGHCYYIHDFDLLMLDETSNFDA